MFRHVRPSLTVLAALVALGCEGDPTAPEQPPIARTADTTTLRPIATATRVWSAAGDFSASANPNGPWTAGWATPGGGLNPFRTPVLLAGTLAAWLDPANNTLNTPNIGKNVGAQPLAGVAPGEVELHPGCRANENAVLRWNAPSFGTYRVTGQFKPGDQGDMPAHIMKEDGVPLEVWSSTNAIRQFDFHHTMGTGSYLEFTVGVGAGGCSFGSTVLSVTITREPDAQMITFEPDPLPEVTFQPGLTVTVGARASSALPISFTVGKGEPCTIGTVALEPGSEDRYEAQVSVTEAGTCTVTASQEGDPDFQAASPVSRPLTIAKGAATLAFADGSLRQTYDGNAKTVVVSTAPADLAGVAVSYSQAGTPVPAPTRAGKYDVVVTLTNPSYRAADLSGVLEIVKSTGLAVKLASPTVTVTYGAAFAGAAFGASVTPQLEGLFAYSIPDGQVLGVGEHPVTVTFTPADDANYDPATTTGTITVDQADQTISFQAVGSRKFGESPFALSATASSGLEVGFSAAGDCSLSGGLIHLTGAGSCTVTARQSGDANYRPAPDVQQTFAIAKANQTIAFAPLPARTANDTPFGLSATATSGLIVAYAATGQCTVSGTTVTISGAGSCTVTADQPGSADYNPAPSVPRTFTITRASQAIAFTLGFSSKTLGDADFMVTAQGGASGMPITFSSITPEVCAVSGSTLHLVGVGGCTVRASQPGNDGYDAAPDVDRSFAVLYRFSGFFQPVDNPATLNKAKAGSAIPIKFSLDGNQGLDVFQSAMPPSIGRISCTASATDVIEQTVTASSSGLTYDTSAGQYVYTWKTQSGYAGTCQKFVVVLKDGSRHEALFQFVK